MNIHPNAVIYLVSIVLALYEVYLIKLRGRANNRVFLASYSLTILALVLYIMAFLTDDFRVLEVYRLSSSSLDPFMKVAASWAGAAGYIIWWIGFYSIFVIIHRCIWLPRRVGESNLSKYGSMYIIYNFILIFLIISLYTTDIFRVLNFTPLDGLGLNPLLRNIYYFLHPSMTLLAYATALILGVYGLTNIDDRFKSLMASISWLFTTLANIFGGIWSYYTLGWGGYWAWDPVETGLLLPWLALTAYFHSIYMGKGFRDSLLSLTAFSAAFAAFITRGGAISPLHGFAGVSMSGWLILGLGSIFLIHFIYRISGIPLKELNISLRKPYEASMGIATLSLLGIYLVLFNSLLYQSIYHNVFGRQVYIDVAYYNYVSAPFTLIFTLFLPLCHLRRVFTSLGAYFKYFIIPVSGISLILTIATYMGLIVWSPVSSTYTNILISILLPYIVITLLLLTISMLDTKIYKYNPIKSIMDIGVRFLHLSIPLLLLGILISGPYTYNQEYFDNVNLINGDRVNYNGLYIKYLGAEFIGPYGEISLPYPTILIGGEHAVPEEALVRIKVYIDGVGLKFLNVRFNFGSLYKGFGSLLVEPVTIDSGLGEYYIVVNTLSTVDIFYYYSKNILNRLSTLDPNSSEYFLYKYILYFMAEKHGLNNTTYMGLIEDWSPETAMIQSRILIAIKYIPLIKLVWLSFVFMVLGELLIIIPRLYRGVY